MLDIAQVQTIAKQAVEEALGAASIDDVLAKETVDWVGDDALEVRVILRPDALAIVKDGKKISTALGAVNDRLQAQGDMRFSVVRYATRADLRREARARAKS
jgi:hypothetical protein